MVFKKGTIPNPTGNPNIGEIAKTMATGPKTEEGKLKVALGQMKSGMYSKIVAKIRQCNKCPLRPKTKAVKIGNVINEVTSAPLCSHYKKNRRKCVVEHRDFVTRLKAWSELPDDYFEQVVMETVARNQMMDASINRDAELLEKGKVGYQTRESERLALDAAEKLYRAKYGDKTRIEADIRQQHSVLDVNALLKAEQNKIIDNDEKFPWEEQDDTETAEKSSNLNEKNFDE